MRAQDSIATWKTGRRPVFRTVDLRSRLATRLIVPDFTAQSPELDYSGPLVPRPVVMHMKRDGNIVTQMEDADYCYLVVTGCVRTVRQMEDGRRQIGEFLLSGELFGWEACDAHEFGAEAVTCTTLHRYKRDEIEMFADRDRDFSRRLRVMMANRVREGRKHVVLLGRATASQRIARFILDMDERTKLDGRVPMLLPMGRDDIADYLGLTTETVTRCLTQFRLAGTISVSRSNIMIFDRKSLEDASGDPIAA